MTWPVLLDRVFRAAVVLAVFGCTAWLVFSLGASGWWFLVALVVCALALGEGDK